MSYREDKKAETKEDPFSLRNVCASFLITVASGLVLNFIWEQVKPKDEEKHKEVYREVIREIVRVPEPQPPPSRHTDPVPFSAVIPKENLVPTEITSPSLQIPAVVASPLIQGATSIKPDRNEVVTIGADAEQSLGNNGQDVIEAHKKPLAIHRKEQGEVRKNVKWHQDLKEAVATASKAHKRVLIYFSNDWALDCKKMEEEVLSSSDFAEMAERNFELVRAHQTIGKNQPELYCRFTVTRAPTILVVGIDESTIGRIREYRSKEDTLERLKQICR